MTLKRLGVELTADVAPLSSGLSKGGQELDRFGRRATATLNRFDTDLQKGVSSSGKLGRATRVLATDTDALGRAQARVVIQQRRFVESTAALNRLQAAGATGSKAYTTALAAQLTAQTRLVRAVAESRKLEAGQSVQSTSAAAPSTAGRKLGQFAATGVGLSAGGLQVGRFAAAAGLGLALHAIVSEGIAYQDSMNVLQASSHATDLQMVALSAEAKRLGNDLTLPNASAADAGHAMSELAKAGLSVNDTLHAGLGTLQLSAAGAIAVADAATYTADALNAFHLAGDQASRVANVLSNAASSSSGEVGDFGIALQQVALVAHGAGFSLEDTTAALAELAHAGLKGSDAGTSLKTAILSLQAPIGTGADAIKAIGLRTRDTAGNMLPLHTIIENLTTSLKKYNPAQRDAAMSAIFGQDAIRAARELYAGGTKGLDEYTAAVSRAGGAQELAAARSKGLGGALRGLQSTAQTLSLSLYEQLAPNAEEFAKNLTHLLQSSEPLAHAFGDVLGAGLQLGSFLASHEQLLIGLSAAYGIRMVGGVGAVATKLQLLTGLGVEQSLTGMGKGAGRFTTALRGLVSAETAATLGLSALVAYSVTAFSKYSEGARQAADQRRELLSGTDVTDERSIAKAAEDLATFQDAQVKAMGGSSVLGTTMSLVTGEFFRADNALEGTAGAMDAVWTKTNTVNQHLADLAVVTGFTREKLIALAKAAGVDLTGNIDEVTRKLIGYYNTSVAGGPATQALAGALSSLADEAQTAKDKTDALKSALDALIGVHLTADQAADKYRESLAKLGSTMQNAKAGVKQREEEIRAQNERELRAAQDRVRNARNGTKAEKQAAAENLVQIQRANKDRLAALREGAGGVRGSKPSLDNTTETGRADKAAIRDVINATLELRDARAREGASTLQQRAIMERGRAELVQVATQYGLTKGELDTYLRRLGDTPATVRTVLTVEGRDKALQAVMDVRKALASLPDHSATQLLMTPFTAPKAAPKGFVDPLATLFPKAHAPAPAKSSGVTRSTPATRMPFADGGLRLPEQATIATGHGAGLVQWAEGETGGEAFVPLAPGKRPRSLRILQDVARRFGQTVVPVQGARSYATGGISVAAMSPGGAGGGTVRLDAYSLRMLREFGARTHKTEFSGPIVGLTLEQVRREADREKALDNLRGLG